MPTLNFDKNSDTHKILRQRIASRLSLAKKSHDLQRDTWIAAEERTLAYVPESTDDAVRRTKREGGEPKYTTIQIPYSFALLMSAHTYWTSVFFARSPVHQYSGRHGEAEMQIQALEALMDYQVQVGNAMGPYYLWLYDIGKYSAGIIGHYWMKEKLHYGQLVEMQQPDGSTQLMQATHEVQGYVGNCIFNVSPWDFMHDPRVSFKDFQKGEFCCRRVRLGWAEIIKRKDAGYYNENIKYLKDRLTDKGSSSGSSVLRRPQFDDTLQDDEQESSKHPAGGVFWEVYIELIPDEWNLGKGLKFPQKWCFTITEDESLIIGISPLGYAHCRFPFDVGESEIEGYGMFTRGIPEIMAPIQNTMDWLINTHFFNVRASMNNQFIVDPSKLVIKDVQNSGPGFIWRLRPEAYGSDISKLFLQVPVQDVTKQHLSDFQQMFGIGEKTLGINEQIMGALNTQGRRTATEVRTSTGFGVNRLKTVSEYISATAFAPHSQKLVQTSQQFYDAPLKLRIVGDLAIDAGEPFINVTPESIAGFYDFVPVDGTMPVDRMAQANLWKEIMAQSRQMPPQILMSYDWGRIFAWAAQLGGLKNIRQFRVQVMPDAMLQAQAQQGNVIPLRGPSGPQSPPQPSQSTQTGLEALAGNYGQGTPGANG